METKALNQVHFNNKDQRAFFTECNKRIKEYFNSTGRTPYADYRWWLKIGIICATMFGAYGLLMAQLTDALWYLFLLMIVFTFCGLLLGFNIAHDASHNALFKSKKANYYWLRAFDFIGISGYLWVIKHCKSHHKYTNVPHYDADIEQQLLIRLSPLTPMLGFHRIQWLYAPIVYGFFSIFLVYVKDFMMLFKTKIGCEDNLKHPAKEVALIITSKLFYTFYSLALPILILDWEWYWILLAWVASHNVASIYAMMILLPVHLVDDTVFADPDEKGNIPNSWAVHQLEATTDFGVNSPWVAWFAGGLNLHLAHHLFPTICHVHYGPLTKIVQDTARDYGLRYRNRTWAGAIRAHWVFLVKMSKKRNPFPFHKVELKEPVTV